MLSYDEEYIVFNQSLILQRQSNAPSG